MPEGLDPDEILFDQDTGQPQAGGKERMTAILGATQPLLDSRLDELIRESSQGPEARTQALKTAAGWLARYKDPVGQAMRMEHVEAKLGVSRQLLMQAMGPGTVLGNAGGGPGGSVRPSAPRRPQVNSSHGSGQGAVVVRPSAAPQRGGGRRPLPPAGLTYGEKVLLTGLARGGDFSALFAQCRGKMPPQSTLADLFDYGPAREFVTQLTTQPGELERFRAAPELVLNGELDTQVRSTLTEALVSQDAGFETEDFRLTLDRAMSKIWARFSQRIKVALADAEAKKDAELQTQLMKEYLDVQRKMKEFNCFYDEA